jgi:hypothetical protein
MDVPSIEIFNASHEYLSQKDFLQGGFENVFILNEGPYLYCALCSVNELTVLKAKVIISEQDTLSLTGILAEPLFKNTHFPPKTTLSFCSMDHEKFFDLDELPNACLLGSNLFIHHDKENIVAGVAHPEKMQCVCIPKETLIPRPKLESSDGLSRKPSEFGT